MGFPGEQNGTFEHRGPFSHIRTGPPAFFFPYTPGTAPAGRAPWAPCGQCSVELVGTHQYDPPAPSTALPLSGIPAEATLLIFKSPISSPHKQHRLPETGCRRKPTTAGSVLLRTRCKTHVLTRPKFNDRKIGSKQ